ncbi:hypothetical protein D3C73_1292130 [compost metagenome]
MPVSHLVAVAHIQRQRHDSHPVSCLQSGRFLLQQPQAAGSQDQLHPLAGQGLGDGQPYAAGPAADQGPFCSQFVHLVSSSNGAGIVAAGARGA